MKETFDALYKLGYKNIEYYFIRNYNSYTIPLVVDTFRKSLTDTLNYVKILILIYTIYMTTIAIKVQPLYATMVIC